MSSQHITSTNVTHSPKDGNIMNKLSVIKQSCHFVHQCTAYHWRNDISSCDHSSKRREMPLLAHLKSSLSWTWLLTSWSLSLSHVQLKHTPHTKIKLQNTHRLSAFNAQPLNSVQPTGEKLFAAVKSVNSRTEHSAYLLNVEKRNSLYTYILKQI